MNRVRVAIVTSDGKIIDDSLALSPDMEIEKEDYEGLGRLVVDTLKRIKRHDISPGDTARAGNW